MLSQYSQNVTVSGAGLVKCPFEFRENYDVGDVITLRFSDKTAVTQILSVTEQWSKGSYTLSFSFGKPQNSLAQQISLLLKKISNASKKTKAIECVKWYTIPTDTAQSEADVTFDTLGFTGAMTADATFTLYADDEGTGSKIYNVYVKNLSGSHTLTLTTGKAGATSYALQPGTYNAQIYVDENGSIIQRSISTINSVTANSSQAVTSGAVASAVSGIEQEIDALQPVDVVSSGNMKAVTSNAVAGKVSTLASQIPIHGIYQLVLTPREISTGSELTSIVRQIYNQGYRFIIFWVTWDDYEQYPDVAGSSGIIFIAGGSVLGVGLFMRYDKKTFSKGFMWVDNWDKYTGIYDL
jgi:hypothetical protein